MNDDIIGIPNDVLKDRKSREEYAMKLEIHIGYLEILVFVRNMDTMSENDIIDKFDLPWDKK